MSEDTCDVQVARASCEMLESRFAPADSSEIPHFLANGSYVSTFVRNPGCSNQRHKECQPQLVALRYLRTAYLKNQVAGARI